MVFNKPAGALFCWVDFVWVDEDGFELGRDEKMIGGTGRVKASNVHRIPVKLSDPIDGFEWRVRC